MASRPRWDLTIFKVHFGLVTLKGYTKGEHVLRFEAIVHNTRALGCGRVPEKFPEIVTRLAAMVDRFTTMLNCVDIGFLPDGILDELPTASRVGATRVGGVDLNKPRMRNQAAYDLRKLRAKLLVVKPGRSWRYLVPGEAARTITALSVLRDQVLGPIVAGVRVPRQGRPPQGMDPHRPGIRGAPCRHADPLRRSRAHHQHAHGRMNNFLSMQKPQASSSWRSTRISTSLASLDRNHSNTSSIMRSNARYTNDRATTLPDDRRQLPPP